VSEFLAMGGYAFYVWGAYGVTALVLIAEAIAVRSRLKAARGAARAEEGER